MIRRRAGTEPNRPLRVDQRALFSPSDRPHPTALLPLKTGKETLSHGRGISENPWAPLVCFLIILIFNNFLPPPSLPPSLLAYCHVQLMWQQMMTCPWSHFFISFPISRSYYCILFTSFHSNNLNFYFNCY